MEYSRVNNLSLAALSFETAKRLKKRDPFVLNEIGCVQLKNKDYV